MCFSIQLCITVKQKTKSLKKHKKYNNIINNYSVLYKSTKKVKYYGHEGCYTGAEYRVEQYIEMYRNTEHELVVSISNFSIPYIKKMFDYSRQFKKRYIKQESTISNHLNW